ncbi:hypothetical protein [Chishuiella sp.]|uniref:hypothetical protein n=1 Tax=Chishuiella sp. TaxID=1969467 RepID=UPI0028ADAE7F|nr:hypothetical protein [Chishuiella sp.]
MRNNPFITFALLLATEIALVKLIIYIDLIPLFENIGLLVVFFVPITSILIAFFLKNIRFQKEFQSFSIFILVISILGFSVLSYLLALGGAYQH